MKPVACLFLFSLLLLSSYQVRSQSDTLRLSSGFTDVQANPFFSYFNTPKEISADSAWKIFRKSLLPLRRIDKINFGPINGYYWLLVNVKNESSVKQELFLEIRQPHIYRITFFLVHGDTISQQSDTGIKYDFFSRSALHRYFDFPISLQQNADATILVMVHHLNSLSLPIHLLTQKAVHQSNYTQNMVWGYWLGFLSFCAFVCF